MAETFYEGDVRLTVRLDELDQQLLDAENTVRESSKRMADNAIVVQQSFNQSFQPIKKGADEASESTFSLSGTILGLAGAISTVAGKAMLARRIGQLLNRTLALTVRFLGPIGLAAGVLITARAMNELNQSVGRVKNAFDELDGTRAKMDLFINALGRVPIVGGLASFAVKAVSKDYQVLDQVLIKANEDGTINLRLLGQVTSALQSVGNGAVWAMSRFLGMGESGVAFGQIADEIDEVNERLRVMNARAEATLAMMTNKSITDSSFVSVENTDRRLAIDSATNNLERVTLQAGFDTEDLERQYDAMVKSINKKQSEELAKLRSMDDKELPLAERTARQEAIMHQTHNALAIIEKNRLSDLEKRAQLNQVLIAQAKQQQIEEDILAAQQREARKEDEDRRIKNAQSEAGIVEAMLSGDDFRAQRLRVQQSRFSEIERAQTQEEVSAINDRYNARLKMIDQREAEEVARRAEIRDEQAKQEIEDEIRRQHEIDMIYGQAEEARLRSEGNNQAADIASINRQFDSRALEAELDGNTALIEALETLREEMIKAASKEEEVKQEEERFVSAQQVSATRFAASENAPRIQQDQLEVLRRIDSNTRNPKAAVLGSS